jgi:spore germination protein GerM
MLIEGPKSENLERTIPEGTLINKIELKENILWIDFSNEFITNHKNGAEEEAKTIYSIVNTMTQLNEVDGVKIVIDGKEDSKFLDNAISLKDAFVPKE